MMFQVIIKVYRGVEVRALGSILGWFHVSSCSSFCAQALSSSGKGNFIENVTAYEDNLTDRVLLTLLQNFRMKKGACEWERHRNLVKNQRNSRSDYSDGFNKCTQECLITNVTPILTQWTNSNNTPVWHAHAELHWNVRGCFDLVKKTASQGTQERLDYVSG